MRKFTCGQIWLVNFDPSFGHEYRKVRPALIVQNDEQIEAGPLLTVIPLSSKVVKVSPLDVRVKRDERNRLMRSNIQGAAVTYVDSHAIPGDLSRIVLR